MRAKRASVARAKRRLRLLVSTVPTDVLQNLTHGEAQCITNIVFVSVFFISVFPGQRTRWFYLY